jgi:hypothetical protein
MNDFKVNMMYYDFFEDFDISAVKTLEDFYNDENNRSTLRLFVTINENDFLNLDQ